MIDEIKLKQNQILSKSQEDETKRVFIEAILSLLITGVISMDKNFNINLINNSSLKILGKNNEDLFNKNFLHVFPEWEKIINNFANSKRLIENFQFELIINDNARNINFRIIFIIINKFI